MLHLQDKVLQLTLHRQQPLRGDFQAVFWVVRGPRWRHLQRLRALGEEMEKASEWLQKELEPCCGRQSRARFQTDKTQEDQEWRREEEKQAKKASQV